MTAQNRKSALAFQLPEFLSRRDDWNDSVSPRRLTTLGRLAERFAKLRARSAAFSELSQASDRDLHDMGLNRGDVGRIFDHDFAEEHARRGLLAVRSRRSGGGL